MRSMVSMCCRKWINKMSGGHSSLALDEDIRTTNCAMQATSDHAETESVRHRRIFALLTVSRTSNFAFIGIDQFHLHFCFSDGIRIFKKLFIFSYSRGKFSSLVFSTTVGRTPHDFYRAGKVPPRAAFLAQKEDPRPIFDHARFSLARNNVIIQGATITISEGEDVEKES